MKKQQLEWEDFTTFDAVPIGMCYVAGYYITEPEYVFTTLMYVGTDAKDIVCLDPEFAQTTKSSEVVITHWSDYFHPAHPEEDIGPFGDPEKLSEEIEEFTSGVTNVDNNPSLSMAVELLEETLIYL